jgi:hypothetical protein
MSSPAKRPIDWDRITAIATKQDDLLDAGRWNRKAFEELLAQARQASPDEADAYEFLLIHADPSWL